MCVRCRQFNPLLYRPLFSGPKIGKLVSFIADSSSLLFLQRSMKLNYPTRPEKRTTNLNVAYFLGENVNFRLGLL
jgi:hypothetical protein